MGDRRADLDRILASATRMGIELDRAEAATWLDAVDAAAKSDEIAVDTRAGVFGHRITMLDFSDADLAYFRRVGELVAIPDSDDVETALALSGSAAQSKIQTYPGDCDYFQRINIIAESREAACLRLAEVMWDKACGASVGDTYRLIEAKFGNYPVDVIRHKEVARRGTPIAWSPEEAHAGEIAAVTLDGAPVVIRWNEVAVDPGWCKLDWVVADPVRRKVANASNMFDVTWESPDGAIVPLDGYLDPYFQEVYLDASDVPLFSKLANHVSADALDDYVVSLESEVRKYCGVAHANYGKAAKRMYNIFRLDGRYHLAAFLRELFDEPATVLYQVYAVVRTLEEAAEPGSPITVDAILGQLDELVLSVVRALEGSEEEAIVKELLALRDSISRHRRLDVRSAAVETSRAALLNLVNNFFYDKMTAMPEVKEYMASLQDTA